MSYVILDMDNCISDDGWRIQYINKSLSTKFKYRKYHLLASFDKPCNTHLFKGENKALILTARPNEYRDIAEEWLLRAGVDYDHLLMRPDNVYTKSVDVKHSMIRNLECLYGIPPKDIAVAYDDNPEIVEMYRREGIEAHELRIHNISYQGAN